MYYDDHINDNYIPTAYESSDTREKTVKYLNGIIKDEILFEWGIIPMNKI